MYLSVSVEQYSYLRSRSLGQDVPAFYRGGKFVAFIWTEPRVTWTQLATSWPLPLRNTLMLSSCLYLSPHVVCSLQVLQLKFCLRLSSPCSCYMTSPYKFTLFDELNRYLVKSTNCEATRCAAFSSCLLLLCCVQTFSSKYVRIWSELSRLLDFMKFPPSVSRVSCASKIGVSRSISALVVRDLM